MGYCYIGTVEFTQERSHSAEGRAQQGGHGEEGEARKPMVKGAVTINCYQGQRALVC
jgi:hypothetical protein